MKALARWLADRLFDLAWWIESRATSLSVWARTPDEIERDRRFVASMVKRLEEVAGKEMVKKKELN